MWMKGVLKTLTKSESFVMEPFSDMFAIATACMLLPKQH